MSYIIKEELRDSLIGLIILLKKATENDYLFLKNGKVYKFPYLKELINELEELNEIEW